MAENKQYITQIQENGNVIISEDVVSTIVEQALRDVDGVDSIVAKPGADIADLIGKNWGKGMKIQIAEDNSINISCNIAVKYGHSVVEVAKNVQTVLTNAVESMAGVKVSSVNVNERHSGIIAQRAFEISLYPDAVSECYGIDMKGYRFQIIVFLCDYNFQGLLLTGYSHYCC